VLFSGLGREVLKEDCARTPEGGERERAATIDRIRKKGRGVQLNHPCVASWKKLPEVRGRGPISRERHLQGLAHLWKK